MEALKAALASHEDSEVIRKLCPANKVPDELRADVWKVRGRRLGTGKGYFLRRVCLLSVVSLGMPQYLSQGRHDGPLPGST